MHIHCHRTRNTEDGSINVISAGCSQVILHRHELPGVPYIFIQIYSDKVVKMACLLFVYEMRTSSCLISAAYSGCEKVLCRQSR